jgi:hypothetical protein
MIGEGQAQFALSVSENPMRMYHLVCLCCYMLTTMLPIGQLLYAEVRDLGITDLVSFARDVTSIAIPYPPDDMLRFEQLKIYICPTGMTLGSVTYPQGFSFLADMKLFGVQADIACGTSKYNKSISSD